MPSVTASAPGKLMLFGEHAVVYGHPCIVTAVSKRMRVRVGFNGKGAIVVHAPQMGLVNYHKRITDLGKQEVPKPVRFIELLVKNFSRTYGLKRGLDIVTESEFSSDYGFGSSAAVSAALAFGITELLSMKLTKKELFDLCYMTVLDAQGVGSGFDVASAIYGGTLYFVGGGTVVQRIRAPKLSLIVGYTGVKADTPTLVRQVAEQRRRDRKRVDQLFRKIAWVVRAGRIAVEKGDFEALGRLMNHNQTLLAELGVSSEELDRLIQASRRAGALGAKLSGAGGGDCMIALVDSAHRKAVLKAVAEADGQVLSVSVGAKGVGNGIS
ncbi:MAG: mevalonate kinase [Candidatus Chisholmbacteria bacterium RIFCSPLOWO2_01_FULL_50_28]|uniref:Mevalonate kinase n=1 Tax=Candidatus Chisholmbacteria bacterium RIFCSPHIGHO2_01_FULL_52_32 TaxID=1797591 RepID=A0A1G1VUF2_9BACT|nr:MAG: mevalonate kinase [Candidatus Chisholmbacteria bacterium RIFCSPHIGHO2_01_FULL_52_32]OGY19633.1 MAG: mevalonate kinase [Candidatus Chisholmbacteria bacterium RIFCSPLOWO2_01_FULL_50_28]